MSGISVTRWGIFVLLHYVWDETRMSVRVQEGRCITVEATVCFETEVFVDQPMMT